MAGWPIEGVVGGLGRDGAAEVDDEVNPARWYVGDLPATLPSGAFTVEYRLQGGVSPDAGDEVLSTESRQGLMGLAGDSLLTGIIDAAGTRTLSAGYDPVTRELTSLRDVTGHAARMAYGLYTGGTTSQFVTDLGGNRTETWTTEGQGGREREGREIREVKNEAGALLGWQVVLRVSLYNAAGLAGIENALQSSRESVPFFVPLEEDGNQYKTPEGILWGSGQLYGVEGPDAKQLTGISRLNPLGGEEDDLVTSFSGYAFGRPTRVTDAYGNTTYSQYTTAAGINAAIGTLAWASNSLGEATHYAYDVRGRVTGSYRGRVTITEGIPDWENATGLTLTYSSTYYEESTNTPTGSVGRLETTTDETTGLVTRYTYNGMGLVEDVYVKWWDATLNEGLGDWVEVPQSHTEYDDEGRVVKTYDAASNVADTPIAEWTQYSETVYDVLGRVHQSIDLHGGITANMYDLRGNLIRTVSPDGTETRTSYDAMGRVAWSTDRYYTGATASSNPDNSKTSTATHTVYDSLGRVVRTERYIGVVIEIEGNEAIAPTDPVLLSSASTRYDNQGRVESTTDVAGGITSYTYYADGSVHTTTDALGNVTTNRVDEDYEDGRQTSTQDALGRTTTTHYDVLGRVVKVVFEDESYVETKYGVGDEPIDGYEVTGFPLEGGRQETSIDQQGNATDSFYDAAGRLTDMFQPEVADAENSGTLTRPHTHYDYDARGNLVSSTDPKGNITSFGYDSLGRKISRKMADESEEYWAYDGFGRLFLHIDFNGASTKYVYGEDAEASFIIREERFESGLDPFVDTPTETTAYEYDELGRQARVIEYPGDTPFLTPATRETVLSYEPVTGQLAKRATAEGHITYTYDPVTGQHLSTRAFLFGESYGTQTAYTYDLLGRVGSVSSIGIDASTTLGTARTFRYNYDDVGLLNSKVDDGGTGTTSDDITQAYTYDQLNRLASVFASRNSVPIFAQDFTGDDGTYPDLAYEEDGQRGGVIETRYDEAGTVSYTTSIDYTYDAINRLTSETVGSSVSGRDYREVFTFDLNGNRATSTRTGIDPGTTTYFYNTRNQLEGEIVDPDVGANVTNTYGYDLNGNQVYAGTSTYTWDVRNRLIEVRVNGVNPVVFITYDENNQRVRESEQWVVTPTVRTFIRGSTFLNDSNNASGFAQVIQQGEYGTSNTYTGKLDYTLGLDVETDDGNALIRDQHGSVRTLLASNGQQKQLYDYRIFGNGAYFAKRETNGTYTEIDATQVSTIHRFGGDGEYSILIDGNINDARIHRPGAPVWMSEDPRGLVVGDLTNANLYGFVSQNPVYYTDPTGLFSMPELMVNMRTVMQQYGSQAATAYNAYDRAGTVVDAAKLVGQFITTGSMDPIVAATLLTEFLPFGRLMKYKVIGNSVHGVTDALENIYKNSKGYLPINRMSELIGEVGAGLVAKANNWIPTNFPRKYHGIESVFEDEFQNLIILEAKGGTSRVLQPQMSREWILKNIDKLRNGDSSIERDWGRKLFIASQAGKLKGGVVSTGVDHTTGSIARPQFVIKNWNDIGPSSF